MPTIPFGINRATGKEENIDQASKINKYVCCICKQPLIIRDGTEKEKHFAHFRPLDDCILRTIHHYDSHFENMGKSIKSGIYQNFDDWMKYVRAVERGDLESAAELWDFEIEVIEEAPIIEEPPAIEEIKPEPEPIIEEAPKPIEPIRIPAKPYIKEEETKQIRVLHLIDTYVDMEWIVKQAVLKPIVDGKVANCPIDGKKVMVDQCEFGCKYFQEIRQPMVNPDKPNVVVCSGHHQHQAKLKEKLTLFDF